MAKPQPSSMPISESFTGDIGHRISGISDHHIPSGYEDYSCIVHELTIEMLSFQTLLIKGSFTINGNPDSIKDIYNAEQWKYHRTRYLLEKEPHLASRFKTPAPLFALLLNKRLQVVDAKIRIARKGDLPLIFDQSCELILLPDSFPPLAGLPEGEIHSYFDKKATILYSDLILNGRYDFEIELEANAGTFEFAPVFPYGEVTIEKFKASSPEYDFEPLGIKVNPTRSNNFSEWYEKSLNHKVTMEPSPPSFNAASPFRGTDVLFDIESLVLARKPQTKKEFEKVLDSLLINLNTKIELKNYETIRFAFLVGIPENKNIEVNVRTIQRPLPPRIYEQMQSLPMYQDVLVRYDIFNLSKEKLKLRIETEILEYTEKARKIITVDGINNELGKRSREVAFQCPRLKKGVLEQLLKPERAMMHCTVTNEETKEVLFDETRNVDLLANDEMVWEIKDIRSNTKYELHDFICAWITPRDNDGLIEKVRTEAAKLRSSKVFGDQLKSLQDIESHVRAIYDHLSAVGMTYVNQPFSSTSLSTSQRVVLPENVLKNNAGNCIDLVVLFASILEGIGVYSLIFIPEGHAFIGWGNKNNPEEILFLETTVLGKKTFDEATEYGKKAFKKDFTLTGMPTNQMIPPFLVAQMRGCHIIDTGQVRYSGKISSR